MNPLETVLNDPKTNSLDDQNETTSGDERSKIRTFSDDAMGIPSTRRSFLALTAAAGAFGLFGFAAPGEVQASGFSPLSAKAYAGSFKYLL